jgi:hypothetical protein
MQMQLQLAKLSIFFQWLHNFGNKFFSL